ncbi:preprotein translocase subunit YajC [Cellulosilyticum sp. I15G10I2]|uniref:preprotein translocase subunit YajC n=1 Tax=Cellulosilyticum sp. I15G10I2 TaxID=1892843 RepID=UPI00085C3298|nr:preprotein translocase subunit YajC [Cellulosilyticum sp. I15G10I2]
MNLILGFTGGAAGGGVGMFVTVAYMAVFFGIMWFLVIRPQKKREKQVAEMQNTIKVGDHVLLQSGEYGKVVDVVNDLFVIEFGLNKSVRIPVKKAAVAAVQEPNLTVGKKVEPKVGTKVVEEDGVEYEYIEVEEEVEE